MLQIFFWKKNTDLPDTYEEKNNFPYKIHFQNRTARYALRTI